MANPQTVSTPEDTDKPITLTGVDVSRTTSNLNWQMIHTQDMTPPAPPPPAAPSTAQVRAQLGAALNAFVPDDRFPSPHGPGVDPIKRLERDDDGEVIDLFELI